MEEITEEYAEFFQGKETIPIYKVKESELGWSNKLIIWYRKRFFGVEGGAEFRDFGFRPEIRVSENVREDVFDEVVRHEVNHYVYREEDDQDMLRLAFVPLLGVLLVNVSQWLSIEVLYYIGAAMIVGFIPLFFLFIIFRVEKRADRDVDIPDKSFSWRKSPKKAFLNSLLPLVAALSLPLNLLSFVEHLWHSLKEADLMDRIYKSA